MFRLDHRFLTHRDDYDEHPIHAITGLSKILDGLKSLFEPGEGEHSIQQVGGKCKAQGEFSIARGYQTYVLKNGGHEGHDGDYATSDGMRTTAIGPASHTEGAYTTANNACEHGQGRGNLSHIASDDFGNSGNTLWSIGIGGTDAGEGKNAVEVMQNGDVYIIGLGGYDGTNIDSAQTLQQVLTSSK